MGTAKKGTSILTHLRHAGSLVVEGEEENDSKGWVQGREKANKEPNKGKGRKASSMKRCEAWPLVQDPIRF